MTLGSTRLPRNCADPYGAHGYVNFERTRRGGLRLYEDEIRSVEGTDAERRGITLFAETGELVGEVEIG